MYVTTLAIRTLTNASERSRPRKIGPQTGMSALPCAGARMSVIGHERLHALTRKRAAVAAREQRQIRRRRLERCGDRTIPCSLAAVTGRAVEREQIVPRERADHQRRISWACRLRHRDD